MAYTRKSEKIINIMLGILVGTIITASVIVAFIYINKPIKKVQSTGIKVQSTNNKVQNEEKKVQSIVEETGLGDDERVQDYDMIKLPSNLKIGDYVDVRIKDVGNSDMVVLAKKEVLELNGGMVWFKINGKERRLMNKAMFEVSNDKSILYTTVYINPQKQIKAEVGYGK
ncbi:MAG: hypothetical protein A2Y24_03610 [Clostridiales bacterium GWE2_32_10]|nr:MAG: hypothetical protein A2Y24_03610 [Clostridiales bacterium GWE2_32_10]HBY19499.1 hypothetical protein [Clostridiales bacterium]